MYAILKGTTLNGNEYRVKVMVLNATFNYISVISCCIGSCKSNYHTITTTTAP